MPQVVLAVFRGTINMDNSEIMSTDVTYTFTLNFENDVPSGGKIMIRFPAEFENAFAVTGCEAIDGLSQTGVISCNYLSSVRILTVDGGFPNLLKQVTFQVKGVTNPSVASTTSFFEINSFRWTGAEYSKLETSSTTLTVTPTAGALSNESLSLAGTVVGSFSALTVELTTTHTIPKDGKVAITFPKWNPFAGQERFYESIVSASTSPGEVSCDPVSGLTATKLFCVYTRGSSEDTVEVLFNDLLTSDVPAGATISFKIHNVRAPPSTTPLAGFSFRTYATSGSEYLIDETVPGTVLQVAATTPAIGSPARVEVTASETSINRESTLTIRIQNLNPLPARSNLQLTIPDNFDFSKVDKASTLGASLDPNPAFTFDALTGTLSITAFNLGYLQPLEFIYINVGPVTNPDKSEQSKTFTVTLQDNNGSEVEGISDGIYFTPTAGGFNSVGLEVSDDTVSEESVVYTFTLHPEDVFTKDAILKVTLPPQLTMAGLSSLKNPSSQIDITVAQTKIYYNSVIEIQDAFPNGYTDISKPIVFGLTGFKNPPTTEPTSSFEVAIFYEEYVNEVARYRGTALTFQATASTNLDMSVTLSARSTGQKSAQFLIEGETTDFGPIVKGSYLKIHIPSDFKIEDIDRVASSCTIVSGFSDEITCQFIDTDFIRGHTLIVRNGFDSATFPGGKFSFYLSEIMNPSTTERTKGFDMQIYDKNSHEQYILDKSVTKKVSASEFSFAFVESLSPVNGVSTLYKVSLTLGVETPAGATLMIQLPEELVFDPQKEFTCRGVMNVAGSLSCYERNGRVIHLRLVPDANGQRELVSGTTITFELGYILNPLSLRQTGTFVIQSFRKREQYFYINEAKNNLRIRNTEKGAIKINSITQEGSTELGESTSLRLKFTTQNVIPAASILLVTVPSNLVIDSTPAVTLNLDQAISILNPDAYQFRIVVNKNNMKDFDLLIKGGLKNPSKGPYTYDKFTIEVLTADEDSIDQVITQEPWVDVACVGNCKECSGNLAGCESCTIDQELNISFYLTDEGSCVSECKPGEFEGPGYKCLPCEYPCLECNLGPTMCSRCDANFERPFANPLTLSCNSECPEGTYLDKAQGLCLKCNSPCLTCTSGTECLTCDRSDPDNLLINFFAKDKQCYEECPNISVPSPSKLCLECISPCVTCTELPDQCTECEENTYLLNGSCEQSCPFGYYRDSETWTCQYTGELDIPYPFTILAAVLSVGLGISSFIKGSSKEGKAQDGTAFFITTLACVDFLLRFNWLILAVTCYNNEFYVTFVGMAYLLLVSIFLNIYIWRRWFHQRFHFEDDPLFSAYINKYRRTSRILIYLSYFVTFHIIRLSYSRLLGKKQFMARFQRRRRYYRLIGRLSILGILLLYVPAIAFNIFALAYIGKGETIYYLGVDSLILVIYACILIAVVLTQREKLLDSNQLINFKELFRTEFNEEEEAAMETLPDQTVNTDAGMDFSRRAGGAAGMKKLQDTDNDDSADQMDVQSAKGFEDYQKLKKKMYQTEIRGASYADGGNQALHDQTGRSHAGRSDNVSASARPVSVIDYNEFRKLEDKHDRILLKKILYERKREQDEINVGLLGNQLENEQYENVTLSNALEKQKERLERVKYEITYVDKTRDVEVKRKEQRKREQIMRKQGVNLGEYNSQSPKPTTAANVDRATRSVSPSSKKKSRKVSQGSREKSRSLSKGRNSKGGASMKSFGKKKGAKSKGSLEGGRDSMTMTDPVIIAEIDNSGSFNIAQAKEAAQSSPQLIDENNNSFGPQ